MPVSIRKVANQFKSQAGQLLANLAQPQLAKIVAADATTYYVKVEIQPPTDSGSSDAIQTDWLPPPMTFWVGNAWGMLAPPSNGDMAVVIFQNGDLNFPIVLGYVYTTQVLPPAGIKSGEFCLFHQSGSFLKLTNDGKVSLNGNVEIDVTSPEIKITATTEVKIIANTDVLVDAPSVKLGQTSGAVKKLLNELAANVYNSHTHTDPQGGVTGVPNQLMNASDMTSNAEAT
ncbi:MAG TPA: phage baseplate assembly protein V [Cyclobacteriaceae bacterium]|nr:phage baseplate assembly protein V [Cyclobacteriaceae bacterium]